MKIELKEVTVPGYLGFAPSMCGEALLCRKPKMILRLRRSSPVEQAIVGQPRIIPQTLAVSHLSPKTWPKLFTDFRRSLRLAFVQVGSLRLSIVDPQ